jgi:hypothetical protein
VKQTSATHKRDLLTHKRDLLTHKRDLLTHKRDLLTHKRDLLTHKRELLTYKIGVGEADFSNMNHLDSDGQALTSNTTGARAVRDIVQVSFISMLGLNMFLIFF